jgi:hypothetical protein
LIYDAVPTSLIDPSKHALLLAFLAIRVAQKLSDATSQEKRQFLGTKA